MMNDPSAALPRSGAYPPPPPPGTHSREAYAGRPQDVFRSLHDSIVRAAHEAIVTVDQQQRIVMINPAAQRMFGCTAADALGSSLSRFIPPESRAAHAEHVRAFDNAGTAERQMAERGTVVGLRANGERFPAEATISRLDVADEFGAHHYFTALVRDVSALQGLKSEVEELKTHMREVFDLAPVAIWITDQDRIVFANHACAALFAASDRHALVGLSIFSLLHPASQPVLRENMAQALRTNQPCVPITEQIARLDGETRLVEIVLAPLARRGASALQMVITDITETRRAAEELERSRAQLRRLAANLVTTREEERQRIARELHDELGQRLAALQLELAGLSPQQSEADGERIAAMRSTLASTMQSVRHIVSELRPLMLDDLGLCAAIEWLAQDVHRRLGIVVALDLEPVDDVLDGATAIALYRMVQEALTNVARHARARRVTVSLRRRGGAMVLVVRDDGIGFPTPRTQQPGSHGLIGIEERATMLGGRLQLSGGDSGGACLTVELPMPGTPAGTVAPGTVPAVAAAPPARRAGRKRPPPAPRAAP